MENQYFERRDAKNAKLQVAIAGIDAQLARLAPLTPSAGSATEASSELAALRTAWSSLVTLLELEPLREVSECPSCHRIGMREATLCGHCWTALTPPAATVTTSATSAT